MHITNLIFHSTIDRHLDCVNITYTNIYYLIYIYLFNKYIHNK